MTTIYDSRGEALELGEQLGSPGGEGTTFSLLRDPSLCAKIYHSTAAAEKLAEVRRKLERMIASPPADPTLKQYKVHSFAWPQQLLFSDQARQNLCGFTMPALDLKQSVPASAYIDFTGRRTSWTGTWEHLLAAARNLASVVEAMHRKQHIIGDINDRNIFISSQGLVSLIDCDSFQIADATTGEIFRCNVAMDEYQPPEYTKTGASIATDRFALAVLLFRLLMQGTHPYAACGPAVENASSSSDKILLGKFPYQNRDKEIEPPPHALPFAILPNSLRELFLRCFCEGNQDPQARPTATEWKQSIDHELKRLRRCKENSSHLYTKELRHCPWCEQVAQGKDDPFPAGQIPVATRSRWWHSAHLPASSAENGEVPPQLKVDKIQARFLNAQPGQLLPGKIEISNIGGGILEGKIAASSPWIALSTTVLDRGRHRQEIAFQVSTVNWACGMQDRGTITITSNGGTSEIPIQVSIQSSEPIRKKLQTRVILPSSALFALLSIVLAAAFRPSQGVLFAFGLSLAAVLLFGTRSLIVRHKQRVLSSAIASPLIAAGLYGLSRHPWSEPPTMLIAVLAGTGMFFALYAALMLLESRLLILTAKRHRRQIWLLVCGAAIMLAGFAFLPLLLLMQSSR